jgi:DNA-binding PadR family transcriptional regulator
MLRVKGRVTLGLACCLAALGERVAEPLWPASGMSKLSHHESHVLATILRWQPTTAYFVRKSLERGLASTFSSSPGSVYPAVQRLKQRGLVEGVAVEADGRSTEQISCTPAGVSAVRDWIRSIEPADALPEDPWRTRMAHAALLDTTERLEWLIDLRKAAERQREALSGRGELAADACHAAAIDNARMLNEARLAWLDRTIAGMVTSG